MGSSADLRKLIADFGKIPPDLRRTLRADFKEVADPILQEVKRRSSWSSRIPAAARISVKFGAATAGVTIVVASRRAPHARPYEHGGVPGDFRHPVFKTPGRRSTWVSERARPFFYPSVFARGEQVEAAAAEIVARVARQNGWH